MRYYHIPRYNKISKIINKKTVPPPGGAIYLFPLKQKKSQYLALKPLRVFYLMMFYLYFIRSAFTK